MGNAKNNVPPTPAQIKKVFNIIGRDYGELSESMKNTAREILTKYIDYEVGKPSNSILSEMILSYCYEMYGKTKISKGNDSPNQLEKGTMAEDDAISMLSKLDGFNYKKNETIYENRWFKGVPDVVVLNSKGNAIKVIDIKVSYDLPSFIMNKYKPESTNNILQLMGYMDLLNCKEGEIVHCLPNMPEQIVNLEKKRLQERYKTLELDELEIDSRLDKYISNMEYSEIPDEFRIFRRNFTRNNLTIKAVKTRVTSAKKWMKEIHQLFVGKSVNLSESKETVEEGSI